MTTNYKRQSRQMPQAVRDKIAAKLKGRKLSPETKKRIADGQKRAWAKIQPQKDVTDVWPTDNNANNENGYGNNKKN